MTRLLLLAACVVLSCSACGQSSVPPAASSAPADLVVELHVPLTRTAGLPENAYPYPWIQAIEDRAAGLTLEADGAEDYDDGEELGDTYAFFLTGEDQAAVLAAAKRIGTGPDVPAGAYVIVNDSAGAMGAGKRVELSEIP